VDGQPDSPDDEIDEHATPRGDESSQDANMVPQGGGPNVRDDNGDGAGTSHDPGDVEPVYSRDFRDTANEALAMRHLATRKPKLNSCETCRQAKAQRIKHLRAARKSESRIHKSRGPIPVRFCDQITLGQIICHRDNNHGCGGETNAITMIDRALSFRWAKRLTRHAGANNLQAVREFQGAREEDKIMCMCSDSALELTYVSRNMGIAGFHDTNIPGDSQGTGVAENNNRDIKSGIAALLSHAGMPLTYWRYAIRCYCFGRNAVFVDGESPYGKHVLACGGNFDQSKMFVFESAVRFIPSKVTGDKTEQFSGSTQPGVCVGYGINSGCIWSGEYLVARAKEFADTNYHAGQREGDGKFIVVQRCANVQRDDATADALFDFPLKEKHSVAFKTPDGWLDSWWRWDDNPIDFIIDGEDGGQEQAVDIMRRGQDALIEVEDHLLPEKSHREWLDSSEGAYVEKSVDNKDVTVCPAIMIPAGTGLITVAPGRVDLRSQDVIVEDSKPLTAQEWEIVEAMGDLREFSYDNCSATTLSEERPEFGPPMDVVVAISFLDKLSGEFITMNGIEQFRIPYKPELNTDGTIVPSADIKMNRVVDLRTIHYFGPITWAMRGNWSSGRYIHWTKKTTRPFEKWPEAWNADGVSLEQRQISIADWKKTKARRDEYEKKARERKVIRDRTIGDQLAQRIPGSRDMPVLALAAAH
jgi:hypothetical protein